MTYKLALFSFLSACLFSVSANPDRMWDLYMQKIINSVPGRGTNSKADQQVFFREHGKAPQFSEIFKIDPQFRAPKTLFLATEDTYVILKGSITRSGIKADLVPIQYFTSKRIKGTGKDLIALLRDGGYRCVISMANSNQIFINLDAQSKAQLQILLKNGLRWLEINPSRRNKLITDLFPAHTWKKTAFETSDKTKFAIKKIGNGAVGALFFPINRGETDYFTIFQAYQHILSLDGKLAAALDNGQVSYHSKNAPYTAVYSAEFFDEVRKTRYTVSAKVQLKTKGSFALAVPKNMPSGEYMVKVRLWNPDRKASVSCAGKFSNLPSGTLNAIELPAKFSRKAGIIKGKIQFKPFHSGGKLKIRLLNPEYRYLPFTLQQNDIKPGIRTFPFALPVDYDFLHANFGYVEVEFTPKAGVSTIRRQLFCAPRSIPEMHDDYLQMLWGMPGIRNEWPAFIRSAQRYGFNSLQDGHYHNKETYQDKMIALGRHGLPVFLEYLAGDTTFGHWGYRNKKHEFRNDLGNRRFRKRIAALCRMRAEDLTPFGVAGYACGEEIGLGTDELCFLPAPQYLFGKWSLKKYGSLKKLNEVWGTSYQDPDDIRGILHADLRKRNPDRPAQWLDFRMFMEELYNSLMEKEFFESFKKADKDVAAGYNAGPYTDVPTQGLNAARLGKTINFSIEYQPGFLGLFMELSGFDMLAGRDVPYLYVVGGYPNHYQKTDANYDYRNWYAVLHGARGFAWYCSQSNSRYSKFSGRYMPRGEAMSIFRTSQDLRRGFGKMLMNAKPRIRAGIYYSRLSRYMISHLNLRYDADPQARAALEAANAEAMRKDPGILGSVPQQKNCGLKSLSRAIPYMKTLMEQSGERWKLVFEDQLLSGELEKRFDVLCLPAVLVLSEPEIKALQRFVQKGGVLIADTMTGWYDKYGNPNPLRKEIDKLFGISRKYTLPDFTCQKVQIGSKTNVSVYRGESVVPQRGASGPANLLIVKKYGKGATMYLGGFFTEKIFNGLNTPLIPEVVRSRTASLLSPRDVKLMVGNKAIPGITGVEISDYKSGPVRMLIFQRRFGCPAENVTTLHFKQKYHVYESRSKKYPGYRDAIPFRMPDAGRNIIYSLLPYKVDAVILKADRNRYVQGEKAKVAVSLRAAGKTVGNGHVIALRVYRPDGAEEFRMEKNLLLKGNSGIFVLPFLPDDPAGTWKIDARDIVTGIQRTLTIELKKTAK